MQLSKSRPIMYKQSYKLTIAAAIAVLALSGAAVVATSPHALAEDVNQPTVSPSPSMPPGSGGRPGRGDGSGAEKAAEKAAERSAQQAERSAQKAAKLAGDKLKACEKREKAMNNIMTRTIDRTTKQTKVFDTIAARTQAFVTSKGLTVANYDTLVGAVAAAKAKTQTDLAAMKAVSTLECDGTDPKGTIATFKANAKLVMADMKAYKTAIKNLIVGVKSSKSAASPKPSTSPVPSVSPNPEDQQ